MTEAKCCATQLNKKQTNKKNPASPASFLPKYFRDVEYDTKAEIP